MTISRADFERLLPTAVGGVAYTREGNAYWHNEGERGWRIRLTALPDLRLALLSLERWQVGIQCEGYSAEQAACFLQNFHLHLRRGGG